MKIESNQLSTETATAPARDAMGKEQFLNLLVAQISHQDPLNPLDDKEFIAQLATFSNLEQTIQTNERLAHLQLSQAAMANAQTTSLIGRSIVANSDAMSIEATGTPPPISFNLEGSAAKITVRIMDSSGKAVRTLTLPPDVGGVKNIAWDGRADNGAQLKPGMYHVEIDASTLDGKSVNASTRVRGTVSSVSFGASGAELIVGGMRIRPADVVEISNSQP